MRACVHGCACAREGVCVLGVGWVRKYKREVSVHAFGVKWNENFIVNIKKFRR